MSSHAQLIVRSRCMQAARVCFQSMAMKPTKDHQQDGGNISTNSSCCTSTLPAGEIKHTHLLKARTPGWVPALTERPQGLHVHTPIDDACSVQVRLSWQKPAWWRQGGACRVCLRPCRVCAWRDDIVMFTHLQAQQMLWFLVIIDCKHASCPKHQLTCMPDAHLQPSCHDL